jgi:ABC-type sugar transport system ATPase subunit
MERPQQIRTRCLANRRNGVRRSTACKTIMGLVPPVGSISFKGRPIAGLRPDQIVHLGVGYVPEDRQVFPGLTVRQNLELGLKRGGVFGRWKFEDVFALFPNLGDSTLVGCCPRLAAETPPRKCAARRRGRCPRLRRPFASRGYGQF